MYASHKYIHVKRVHDMYAISKEKVQLYNYANFN